MDCNDNCGNFKKTYDTWIDTPYVQTGPCVSAYGCENVCEGPEGPKNIPIFNTTYVGRARKHIPDRRINYYDCKKQRGGNCGSTNNIATNTFKENCSAGRCELSCDSTFYAKTQDEQNSILLTQKNNILRKGGENSGKSKKSEYARYVKTTPGFETFSSKKVSSLQTTITNKRNCFVNYWCGQL